MGRTFVHVFFLKNEIMEQDSPLSLHCARLSLQVPHALMLRSMLMLRMVTLSRRRRAVRYVGVQLWAGYKSTFCGLQRAHTKAFRKAL